MKTKRILSITIAIVMVICMLPVTSFSANGTEITLDNGVYDSKYITDFGTVEYSTDDGASWKSIDKDTTSNGSLYMIPGVGSVKMRVTASSANQDEITLIVGSSSSTVASGEVFAVDNYAHIEFRGSGGNGGGQQSGGITLTLDNGVYGSIFKADFGTIMYSVDNGETWKEIDKDTVVSDKDYNIPDAQSLLLKVINAAGNTDTAYLMLASGMTAVVNGAVITLNVSVADARLALRNSAKLEELDRIQLYAADSNGDNNVNAGDARTILRVAAKLDSF